MRAPFTACGCVVTQSFWLAASLAPLALFACRRAFHALLRPQRVGTDIEKILTAIALFAASWATGYALFEA